mgnify:FL=1
MERRKFARAFKVEAVKLIQGRGVTVAQAARDLGVDGTVLRRWVRERIVDPQQAFPGRGQMKPDQLEIERLRREVVNLKAERDMLKKAAVGSSDQRNTDWDTVGLEGDRHGTDGASGLIRGSESGTLAAMETGAIVERDWSGPRQTRGINSWGGVLERGIHASHSAAIPMGPDLSGTRRNFSRPGNGGLDPTDCGHARSSAVDHQSGNPSAWWGPPLSGG